MKLRAYLTKGFGWECSQTEVTTPFDYSSYKIKLKHINDVSDNNNIEKNELNYLLWKYNASYTWVVYDRQSPLQEEQFILTPEGDDFVDEMLLNGSLVYGYFWESTIPFVDSVNDTGILVLPDIGKIGDFNFSTCFLRSRFKYHDELIVHYPEHFLVYSDSLNQMNVIENTSFNITKIRQSVSNLRISYGIVRYFLFFSTDTAWMDILNLNGSDAITFYRINAYTGDLHPRFKPIFKR